ncbi:DMT family transporter [Sulfurospirillum barnesii]|uniref:EamA-like transporter family n=1 Tax=Sulfurospirillum barnesii (strain ATCC 700032 / DSM 10660 / SES-3) TaxID=760154 RepID=I3XWK1_SULBS|nr:DMT family transporter [Sulfurospirillum barnesii]AFL68325.1 EamA-like transporter family [Sulfurospirillum barnesii SES-3]
MNKVKAHLMVLLATFLIAGSFIVSKKLAGVIHPISLTLLRFLVAVTFLAPFILLDVQKRAHMRHTFARALLISFFYTLYFILFFKALEYTSALSTGTLYTLVPLVTAILCIFFFKERISQKQLFVYVCGIVGTLMVVFKGDMTLLLRFSLEKGELIFLGAILCMSLYAICMKVLHKKEDNMLVLVFMTLIGGVLWMFGATLLFKIPLQWNTLNLPSLSYLLYLSIIATFFTSYLYQKGTVGIGPKKVMAYVYLSPASIALLLYFMEGTTLSWEVFLGIGISAVATFLLLI